MRVWDTGEPFLEGSSLESRPSATNFTINAESSLGRACLQTVFAVAGIFALPGEIASLFV